MHIYLTPMIPDFILAICLYRFFFYPKWKKLSEKKLLWYSLLYIYICIILMLTLMPILLHLPNVLNGFSSSINLKPFIDWQLQRGTYLIESLLNITLFIPFGFLIRKSCHLSPFKAVMIGLLFSSCIELLQPLISIDRIGDISDIITNTIGTCIGILVYKLSGFAD